MTDIEKAETYSYTRALVMAGMAGALLAHAWLVDDSTGSDPVLFHGLWIFAVGVWLTILLTRGLAGSGKIREVVNDEVSLANRSRALQTGFWTALLVGIGLYFASLEWEFSLRHTLRILINVSLAVALLRYGWLETR